MHTERTRVRRERPGALRVAFALLTTMLMLYLLTLRPQAGEAGEPGRAASGERVTEEVEFAPLEGHFVQLALCASDTAARVEAARYTARGSAGYVFAGDGWRVLGAGFETAAAAERAAARLAEDERIPARTYSLRAEGALLRVTGAREEIDALRRGEALLRSLLNQMNQLAARLDGGSSAADARTLLAVLRSDAETALEDLRSVAGWAESPVAAGIEALLEQAAAGLEALSAPGDGDALSLAGMIRYRSIALRVGHVEFLRGLSRAESDAA